MHPDNLTPFSKQAIARRVPAFALICLELKALLSIWVVRVVLTMLHTVGEVVPGGLLDREAQAPVTLAKGQRPLRPQVAYR